MNNEIRLKVNGKTYVFARECRNISCSDVCMLKDICEELPDPRNPGDDGAHFIDFCTEDPRLDSTCYPIGIPDLG